MPTPDPASTPSLAPDGFPASGWTPPGGAPKAAPAAAEPPAPPPAADPVPVAPKPKARFAGTGHTRDVPLVIPIEFDGRTYDTITVKRLTVREFASYFEMPVEQRGRLPAFVDHAGEPIPDEVLDALDFSDSAVVMGAMDGFMPAALRVAAAPEQSPAPQAGEASPQP